MTEIYTESQIREPLYFSRNFVLHFRRNGSRIREQRYTVSSPVCPTVVVHMCCTWRSHPILTCTTYLSCVFGKIIIIIKKYKGSLIFGSAYISRRINSQISLSDVQEHATTYGPHGENTCLWGFQPSKTRVKLLSYRG